MTTWWLSAVQTFSNQAPPLFFPFLLDFDLHSEGSEQTKRRPKLQIASLSLENAVKI
jgi:hypothetical protein